MNLTPLNITIISLSLIFIATTLGSMLVFFFKKNFSDKTNNIIIGLASGIMIAASFFGLLNPAIEEATKTYHKLAFLPVIGGFLFGGLFLYLLDKIIPHFHKTSDEEEGIKTNKITKNTKFFLAVTMHNIPEGIAVGLACGLAFTNQSEVAMMSALSLAIGIAIQNFPEGAAVSIPLLEDGLSKNKAFLIGVSSGIVEPIFGILTFFLASYLTVTLPYLLAFAAGAMFYVTIEELLPEARRGNYIHYGLWSFMIGFAIMMILEITLS